MTPAAAVAVIVAIIRKCLRSGLTDAFASFGSVAGIALAPVGSDQIDAAALTRFERGALVLVDATVSFQFVALVAFAAVRAGQVDASAAALVVDALVDIFTAAIAQLVARIADALIRSWQVDAPSIARIHLALVHVCIPFKSLEGNKINK